MCYEVLSYITLFVVVPSTGASEWYQEGWVLALFGLAAALVLLILIAWCLRRFHGDMNVYVRERDPLTTRPKSKLGSQTGSQSRLDDTSERKFPFIGTPSPSHRVHLFYVFLRLTVILLAISYLTLFALLDLCSFSLYFIFMISLLCIERDTLCKSLCYFA